MREPWYSRIGIELLVAIAAAVFVLPVVLIYNTSLKPDAEIVKRAAAIVNRRRFPVAGAGRPYPWPLV